MGDGSRAVLYLRVSTEEQGESGLGLADQRQRLEAEAVARGWRGEVVEDPGVSGSVDAAKRPKLGPALASLGPGDVLAVAKLDRLSRSMLDFARLLAAAEAGGWSIVALDLGVDTTTANGRLVAHMLMAVAEWERRTIGERTSRALRQTAKRVGRLPGTPKTGGARVAPVAPAVAAVVRDAREAGLPPRRIAERLNDYGLASPRGGRWHRESVRRLLARPELAAPAPAA
jgi:DNA invertase Pin-like site-specific DNA recombinase